MIESIVNNVKILHKMYPYTINCDIVELQKYTSSMVTLVSCNSADISTLSNEFIWSDGDPNLEDPFNTYYRLLREERLFEILEEDKE